MTFKYVTHLRPYTDCLGLVYILTMLGTIVIFVACGIWLDSHIVSMVIGSPADAEDVTSTTLGILAFAGVSFHWALVGPFFEALLQKKYVILAVNQKGIRTFYPVSVSPDGTDWIFVNRKYKTWTYHGQSFEFFENRKAEEDHNTHTHPKRQRLQPITVMPADAKMFSDVRVA